jgi:peptidoglycan/LPS O-acetylase OafA/YrhL
MSPTAAAANTTLTTAETSDSSQRIYFPELDGLRFVAFMMVYLFHGGVPWGVLKQVVGDSATRALFDNGGYGVQLFFILSGYLIATLLLREEARYGRIALKAFWVRRILRIWPLYYLIVLVGFLLLPLWGGSSHNAEWLLSMRRHFVPFLGFVGNWSMALIAPIPYDWISILWSVCVEEQFYLIVPLFFVWVVPRFRTPLVGCLLIVPIAVRYGCACYSGYQLLIVFNTFAQFDALMSGVLLALVLGWERDRPVLTRWVRWLQWPLYAVTIWLLSQPRLGELTIWHRTWDYVWIWMCGVGIVVVAVWGKGWLRAVLSYSRLVWLGKISYGLYMYHEIAIWMRARIYGSTPWFANKEELLSIVALALTIGLAAASYYAYERRFLVLKRAWTRVPSRPV